MKKIKAFQRESWNALEDCPQTRLLSIFRFFGAAFLNPNLRELYTLFDDCSCKLDRKSPKIIRKIDEALVCGQSLLQAILRFIYFLLVWRTGICKIYIKQSKKIGIWGIDYFFNPTSRMLCQLAMLIKD